MDRLTQLQLFQAIIKEGSFAAGARTTGLSAAQASKAIRELESHLGQRLIDRTTRSLRATYAGNRLLQDGALVLDHWQQLIENMAAEEESVAGSLRVSVPASLNHMFIADILNHYRRLAPEVKIEIQLNDTLVNLVDGGFDAAVRIGELADSSLIARKIAPVELQCLASPDYLKRHGTPKHPRDLNKHACILDTNNKRGSSWIFQNKQKDFNITVPSTIKVNSPHLCVALAIEGHGIIVTPDFAAKKAIREKKLVPVLGSFFRATLAMFLVYPDRRFIPARLRLFEQTLHEVVKHSPM